MRNMLDKYLLNSGAFFDPDPPPAPPPPVKSFFEGADAETIGHIQNRGWDKKPVNEVALEAIKAHREAEKLIGVPVDRRLTLPAPTEDATAWRTNVWSKLGVPAEAKDYDFATVKDAAGQPIAQALADTLRTSFHAANVPKDAATKVAAEVVKHLDGQAAAAKADGDAKLVEERAALKTSWGQKHDENMLVARAAAVKLGVTPEEVSKLESVVGYSKVMEMFRKVGAGTTEAPFVGGAKPGEISTKEQATARRAELKNDGEWVKRYLAGGVAEVREMTALNTILSAD